MTAAVLMGDARFLSAPEKTRTMAEAVPGDPPGMDEQAFLGLYARTARSLRAYLGRVTGSASLADDLLQETYLRFLRSSFSSDDETHQRNFLYRIATNLMRDHYRRPKREVGDLPDLGVDESISNAVEQRADVGGALGALGERDRAMLWLAYVEGSSHEEIAAALGLRASSIRSMLFRARQRFAATLRERGLHPAIGSGREA